MAKTNDINVSIFTALKVSEMSKVPVLLMSNPGVGKSTTVELFAEVRGYHLQLLRGNSTTESEVLGYDVADTSEGSKTTKHMRPSWYTNILEMEEKGIHTLLFLDEITTANDWVQSALLHLIFERMVGDEKLPDNTLIVSAGNYAQNLSNNMNMLPPLMNRFMIFNITPEVSDLDTFLSKYRGAIASSEGLIEDKREKLREVMRKLDSREISLDSVSENKIGEHVERCICEVTKLLWSREKLINLAEKDLKDIYSDTDDELKLYGFISFRTLNYLRDVTIASYKCFGKDGLISDNYKNMVDGLCGIGVSKDSKGNIKISKVGKNYYDQMRNTVNEIEKMKNSSLPKYERFFFDIIDAMNKRDSKKKVLEKAEMVAIVNKMVELKNDSGVSNIERPVDISIIETLCKSLVDSGQHIIKFNVSKDGASTGMDAVKTMDPSEFAGKIEYWNLIVGVYGSIIDLTGNDKANYEKGTRDMVNSIKEELRRSVFCLGSIRKILLTNDPALGELLPDLKSISTTA